MFSFLIFLVIKNIICDQGEEKNPQQCIGIPSQVDFSHHALCTSTLVCGVFLCKYEDTYQKVKRFAIIGKLIKHVVLNCNYQINSMFLVIFFNYMLNPKSYMIRILNFDKTCKQAHFFKIGYMQAYFSDFSTKLLVFMMSQRRSGRCFLYKII